MKSSVHKKFIIIGSGVIVAIVTYLFALPRLTDTSMPSPTRISSALKNTLQAPQPTPTPMPFAELTIPYLRSRTYESNLGELNNYGSNADYTSYLTSYTSDGFRINGLLTQPTGPMPEGGWPAIIFIHGYIPPTSYRTTQNYASYVSYLARQGFVVFKVDLRGHDQSEGEPGGAYYSSDYIIDVLNARAALQKSGFVHPDKIGIWGHSMAGNVTLRTMAAVPDIRAGVIWAGAVYTYEDMATYGIQDGSYRPPATISQRQRRRQQLRDLYGDFDPQHPFWKQVAPTNYLSDFTGAVQLHHATDDSVVNVGYSRDLAVLLGQAGVTYDFQEYQSGGHNLTGTTFNRAMESTVAFFREHLL